MKKIISLFQRNYDGDRLVRDKVVPGAEWVLAGEGVATRKYDGTACMIRDGKLFKRYDAKRGKTPPPGFEPAQEPDPVTGHHPGWIPVGDGPDDLWHCQAFTVHAISKFDQWPVSVFHHPMPTPDGTYELCGPKVQGNHERLADHRLISHGQDVLDAPRSFNGLKEWFRGRGIEGIVWHHPDGRMVKIKAKDFGIPR